MSLWSGIKSVLNLSRFTESSIQSVDGYGTKGAKPWPFNYVMAMDAAMRGWAYRCVVGTADAAASVPLRLYVRNRSAPELKALGYKHGRLAFDSRLMERRNLLHLLGEHEAKPSRIVQQKAAQFGDEFVEVMDHPILDLLRTADPMYNGFDLARFTFISQLATGNAYLMPIMSPSLKRPVELWPMMPQWIWAIPGKPGGDKIIDGWLYGASKQQAKRFELDEILAFRSGINPRSIYYGYSPTEAAWLTLGTIFSRQQMDKAMYDNMARPDWAIVVEQMNQDQATRLKASIESQFRGPRNAGQMIAMGGKATLTPMQWKPSEMATDTRHLEEVAGAYGYPITKLLANDPNRANAQTGDAGWTKDTILPMLRQHEEALNQNGLLALFGDGELAANAVLAYDDPTPANKTYELQESERLVRIGVRTINEDRKIRGEEPADGGDVLRVQGRDILLMDQAAKVQIAAGQNPFGGGAGRAGSATAGDLAAGSESTPSDAISEPKSAKDAVITALNDLGDIEPGEYEAPMQVRMACLRGLVEAMAA